MSTASPLSSSSAQATLQNPSAPPSMNVPPSPQNSPAPVQTKSQSGEPSVFDGLKTLHAQDLLHVHQLPCARSSLLFGLGAGFGIGGLHLIFRTTRRAGGPVASSASLAWSSMNYFVGAWALGSAGAYQFCQRQRELERNGMSRAREIMARKRREKEEEIRRAREAVRLRREQEAERREAERRARWWGLGRWISSEQVDLKPASRPSSGSPSLSTTDGSPSLTPSTAENLSAPNSAKG